VLAQLGEFKLTESGCKITYNGITVQRYNVQSNLVGRDNEGFLLDSEDWDESLAILISKELDISLTDEHWLVIRFIRNWYELNQTVPEARKLLKFLQSKLDPSRSTRRYLYKLFPYGYGQQACKIAGMRKPLKLMLDV
jgi:TusE/DsrC/DsvC family sulfur relay protein